MDVENKRTITDASPTKGILHIINGLHTIPHPAMVVSGQWSVKKWAVCKGGEKG